LYSLNGKNPTGAVRTKHRTGLTVKHRFRLASGLRGFANYLISEAGSTAWLQGSDIGKAGKLAEARVRAETVGVNYTFLVHVWKREKRGLVSVLRSPSSFFVLRSSFGEAKLLT
jgi:hypothetical protein